MILIFGILFCLSFSSVSYERYVLKTVLRQRERLDAMFNAAADAVTVDFGKSLYEPRPMMRAQTVFEHVCRALTDEEGVRLKKITVSLNGVTAEDETELLNVRESDILELCFESEIFEISALGRKLNYEIIIVRRVTLD